MNLVATRWWSMFFMPSSVLLTGLALGLLLVLLAWRRGRKPSEARLSIALLVGSALLLYLASTPLVAAWAANTLESGYPPVDPATLPKADAIVVLGGSLHATTAPDGTVHLYANHASDRFETAMQAFAAGRAPLIAFGGGSTGIDGLPAEGEWNRSRAIARGVPADCALATPAALYTTDESAGMAEALHSRGVKQIIVCSSATHLRRATAHYEALGFTVTALPSDFATRGAAEEFSLALLIPRGIALGQVDSAAKEWLGILAGRR